MWCFYCCCLEGISCMKYIYESNRIKINIQIFHHPAWKSTFVCAHHQLFIFSPLPYFIRNLIIIHISYSVRQREEEEKTTVYLKCQRFLCLIRNFSSRFFFVADLLMKIRILLFNISHQQKKQEKILIKILFMCFIYNKSNMF